MIPRDIKYQIDHYIEKGVLPSGFLYAILTNDLILAIQKADDTNKVHIPDIVTYLLNYAPVCAYGSIAEVSDWLHAHSVDAEWLADAISHNRIRRAVYYVGRRTSP